MNIKKNIVSRCFFSFALIGFAGCDGGNHAGSESSSSSLAVSSTSLAASSAMAGDSSSVQISSSSASASSVAPVIPSLVLDVDSPAFCGGAGVLETTNPGFLGDAYFNSSNAVNAAMTWQLDASEAQRYMLTFRFANGGDSARLATLNVNGVELDTLNFESTQAWDAWQEQVALVELSAGENTIRLVANTTAGLANINYLSTQSDSLQGGTCPEKTSSCTDPGDVDMASLLACNGNPAECLFGGGTGHYRVTMAFDDAFSGELEVYAESRRKMFSQTVSQGDCVDFMVNVRSPEGQPIQNVDRGTDGLNIRFNQSVNSLTALSVEKIANPTVLFIAGDSTVADQEPQLSKSPASRFTGWGQFIPQYFNSQISVENYADSGEGSAAFRTDGGGLWRLINNNLKAGDWVLIQLGHNDKTTSASLYHSRITNMVTAIRAKGATPILVSPMVRNTGGSLGSQHIYGGLNIRNELSAIADSRNVTFIDLMQLSSEWARSVGQSQAQTFFVDNDRTHSNEKGAELFAKMIVDQIMSQNIDLSNYLREL